MKTKKEILEEYCNLTKNPEHKNKVMVNCDNLMVRNAMQKYADQETNMLKKALQDAYDLIPDNTESDKLPNIKRLLKVL